MNGNHYKMMVAALAHDLRNPLGAIHLNAALLLQHAPNDEHGDKIRTHVAAINRLVTMMTQMTESLLSAEAIDNNRLPMNRTVMDIMNDIHDAVKEMVPQAQHRGVWLEIKGPPDDGPQWAFYDPQRLRQVFINLLSNAIKFSERGDVVKILVTRDAVDTKLVKFEVSNGGNLVPPDNREKLFDRFFQGTQSHGFGGLGLWIAKWIVEQHGGTIWYEARENHNVFHFTLPHEPPSHPKIADIPPDSEA